MQKSHIPTAYKNIVFFDGKVGAVFIATPKGLFLEEEGRFSHLNRKHIQSAEEPAVAVDTEILKMACDWLDSGKVWKCIERYFDYFSS